MLADALGACEFPHVHAMCVTPIGLRAVAKWMEERETMLANFRPDQ
jgi:hypothetical protein